MRASNSFDVCVVGSGPAGASAAAYVAQKGLSVALVEAEAFPRHHIGESLLAASIPLLAQLGVLEKIERQEFVRKRGSVFVWGKDRLEVPLPMPYPHYAYQVERSKFDQILQEHAVACGAQLLSASKAVSIEFGCDRAIRGLTVRKDDQIREISARSVIDATGLGRLGGRLLGYTLKREGPKRLAVSCYFSDVARPDSPCQGDVVTEASRNGWIWVIPLDDKVTSVGWVTDADCATQGDLQRQFNAEVATTTLASRLMKNAVQLRGPHRLRYDNGVMGGVLAQRGLFLAGDAAGFVDPLFSTGIHSALLSGRAAAAGAGAWATETHDRREICSWYDNEVRGHISRIAASVRLIYSLNRDDSRFWSRRNLDAISAQDAELMLRDLGPTGAQFFQQIHSNATHLHIPAPLAPRLSSFFTQSRPQVADLSARLGVAEDCCMSDDLMIVDGCLRRGVKIRSNTQRAKTVCYPDGSEFAMVLRLLDRELSLAEVLQRGGIAPARMAHLSKFVGTLMAHGLISKNPPEEIASAS